MWSERSWVWVYIPHMCIFGANIVWLMTYEWYPIYVCLLTYKILFLDLLCVQNRKLFCAYKNQKLKNSTVRHNTYFRRWYVKRTDRENTLATENTLNTGRWLNACINRSPTTYENSFSSREQTFFYPNEGYWWKTEEWWYIFQNLFLFLDGMLSVKEHILLQFPLFAPLLTLLLK